MDEDHELDIIDFFKESREDDLEAAIRNSAANSQRRK